MTNITSEHIMFVAKQIYPDRTWETDDKGNLICFNESDEKTTEIIHFDDDESTIETIYFDLETYSSQKYDAIEWLWDKGATLMKLDKKYVILSDLIPIDRYGLVNEAKLSVALIVAISIIGGYQE